MLVIDVGERSSKEYTGILKDQAGVAVPLASMTELKISLIDVATGATINSRLNQSCLNAANVTMHATSGLITWSMQPADNIIVTPAKQPVEGVEVHVAEFQATWNAGANGYTWRVEIRVANMYTIS